MTVFGERLGAVMDRLRQGTGSPTFLWKGATVPCVMNTFAKGTVLEEGGYQIEVDAKIFVKKTEFLTVDSTLVIIDSEIFTTDSQKPTPVAGKTLTAGGKRYKIVRTADPLPNDAEGNWVLYLKDPTQ